MDRSSRMEWTDLKSGVLVPKMQTTKTGGRPLLKESPFSNVVLAILGKNSPLQSGVAGEIFTHFQLFIGQWFIGTV